MIAEETLHTVLGVGILLASFLVILISFCIFVRKRMRRFGENESGDVRNIVVETQARYSMKEKKAKVGNKSSFLNKDFKKSSERVIERV